MNKELLNKTDEWEKYSRFFERQEVPSKTTLLREGEISKTAYLIEKGCVRSWFNNNGKDITFQFFFENEFVSSIESFSTHQASLYNIESIEPCVIYGISIKDVHFVMEQSARIKKEIDDYLTQRLFFYQKLFLSRIKDSPENRYQELLKERPEILLRIPQHYIASYLGITPVSLSRIRNRR
ncbi:Crp/Fnr family transcriptional regulator [Fulvivirga maritima]|uniref:Crp/Fnr family transcriptional regulator n=1 Tax=Fulvivirga maritima TaxID=2904247 RepID=UPI001F195D71|nr:Crp/Fnr family transcriptional regulator [Fulvivirga maritima]UII25190.1 Crp/Fnr family transcriptional regulator [Fulvivirga maritima]